MEHSRAPAALGQRADDASAPGRSAWRGGASGARACARGSPCLATHSHAPACPAHGGERARCLRLPVSAATAHTSLLWWGSQARPAGDPQPTCPSFRGTGRAGAGAAVRKLSGVAACPRGPAHGRGGQPAAARPGAWPVVQPALAERHCQRLREGAPATGRILLMSQQGTRLLSEHQPQHGAAKHRFNQLTARPAPAAAEWEASPRWDALACGGGCEARLAAVRG